MGFEFRVVFWGFSGVGGVFCFLEGRGDLGGVGAILSFIVCGLSIVCYGFSVFLRCYWICWRRVGV